MNLLKLYYHVDEFVKAFLPDSRFKYKVKDKYFITAEEIAKLKTKRKTIGSLPFDSTSTVCNSLYGVQV